jgi:rubrerythrin
MMGEDMNNANAAPSDPYLLAMHFEKIAQELYANLAQISERADARLIFARLSKEEGCHYELFSRLRAAYTTKPVTAASRDQAMELMRVHVLPPAGTVSGVALLGGQRKALEMALRMEQDAVAFYRGMVLFDPDHEADLGIITQEEQKHAQIISSLLKALEDSSPVSKNMLSR